MFLHLLRICGVLALPVACIYFANYLDDPTQRLLGDRTIRPLCLLDIMVTEREISCLARDWVGVLRSTAWWALALGVLPVALFLGAALICGTSRWMNAVVFRRLIPVAIALICANMLLQGVMILIAMVLTYVAYIGNPPMAALAVAIGTIVMGAATLAGGAAAMRFDPVLPVRALPLKREEAPKLWSLVEGLAAELGAEPPDAIVVGLEPTFWVIAGQVQPVGDNLPARRLKGRVLFVSLPLMHVLAAEEFRAIIGHELGHFRGRDTEYSARFMPAYQVLTGAQIALAESREFGRSGPMLAMIVGWLGQVPARALMSLLGAAFHGNVQRIGRIREYEADDAATEVADPRAVATALFKIPLYAQLWNDLIADHVARVSLDRPTAPAFGTHFGDMARLLVTPANAVALRAYALEARAEHPFDSHPSSFNRVRELGLDPAEITPGELRAGADDGVAASLIEKLDAIEAILAAAENEALLGAGAIPHVPATMTAAKPDPLHHAAYSYFAALVCLAPDAALRFTGLVDACAPTMPKFDRLVFAGYCRGRREALWPEDAIAELQAAGGERAISIVTRVVEAAIDASGADPDRQEMDILAPLYRVQPHSAAPA